MKKIIMLFTLLFGATLISLAQGSMIKGKVVDPHTGVPVPYANVYVDYYGDIIGTQSDDDGRFVIKPLEPGTYNLTIKYMGYQTKIIEGVLVKKDKITALGALDLSLNTLVLVGCTITTYTIPLIDAEDPSAMTMLAAELQATPAAKNPVEAVAMMNSGIKKSETGQLYFRGSRPESMGYYIDGVKQDDNLRGVPGSSIGSLTVYVGGVPAKYGDVTGGVVVIETKSYFDLYNQWKNTQR